MRTISSRALWGIFLEQSFAQLLERYRLPGAKLSYYLPLSTKLVYASMLLHNYCIDCNGPIVFAFVSDVKKQAIEAFTAYWTESTTSNGANKRPRAVEKSILRDLVVREIERSGLGRPSLLDNRTVVLLSCADLLFGFLFYLHYRLCLTSDKSLRIFILSGELSAHSHY